MSSKSASHTLKYSHHGISLVVAMLVLSTSVAVGQHFHNQSPINYGKASAANCVSRLQAKIDSGKTVLKHDGFKALTVMDSLVVVLFTLILLNIRLDHRTRGVLQSLEVDRRINDHIACKQHPLDRLG